MCQCGAGALGLLITEKHALELMSRLLTAVFENRHCNSNYLAEKPPCRTANSTTRTARNDITIIDAQSSPSPRPRPPPTSSTNRGSFPCPWGKQTHAISLASRSAGYGARFGVATFRPSWVITLLAGIHLPRPKIDCSTWNPRCRCYVTAIGSQTAAAPCRRSRDRQGSSEFGDVNGTGSKAWWAGMHVVLMQ